MDDESGESMELMEEVPLPYAGSAKTYVAIYNIKYHVERKRLSMVTGSHVRLKVVGPNNLETVRDTGVVTVNL